MTKDTLRTTLFIDIETVSQQATYDLLDPEWQKLWDSQYFANDEVANLEPQDRYRQKASLRAEFSKVICVSLGMVMFGADGKAEEPSLYVKSFTGVETDILKKLSEAIAKFHRLCAHNGKSFDYPFLARRFLLNGMDIPPLLDTRGKKPWEIENVDTQELWRFGDTVYPSLNLLAKSFGVPLNETISGDEIHDQYYRDNDIKSIAKKCSEDVVKLAKVYVKMYQPKLDIVNVHIM